MLSEERHNPALYSPRGDMPPPAGMPSLTDPRFANGYRDFLGDGTRLPALRKRFEALLSARSLIRPLYRLLRDAVYEVSDYLVRAACVQGALGTAAPQPSSPVLMKSSNSGSNVRFRR